MVASGVNRLFLLAAILLVASGCESNQVTPESVFSYGARMPILLENGTLCEHLFGEGWTPEIADYRTRLISPAISPDGNLILLTMGRLYYVSDNEVFLANLTYGSITQLTHNDFDEYDAVWTPDGEWIVYSGSVGRESGIYRMRRDGSGRERIVAHNAETIAVSPDGQYIAFVKNLGDFMGGGTLWRAPMDRSSEPVPLLTGISGHIWSIAWSPDGTQIAFALQNSNDDIAGLISSDPVQANRVQTVTSVSKTDNVISVRWSPDGEWLLVFIGLYSPDSARYFSWYRVRPNGDDLSRLPACNIGVCPVS